MTAADSALASCSAARSNDVLESLLLNVDAPGFFTAARAEMGAPVTFAPRVDLVLFRPLGAADAGVEVLDGVFDLLGEGPRFAVPLDGGFFTDVDIVRFVLRDDRRIFCRR